MGVPGVWDTLSEPAPKTKGAAELPPSVVGDRTGLATGEKVKPNPGAVGVGGCTAPVPKVNDGGGRF